MSRQPLRRSGKSPTGQIRLPGSRAAERKHSAAHYKCTKCGHAYKEPEAGGTICPACGCKYVHWLNHEEFVKLAEEQDRQLALKAERALEEAANQAGAAKRKSDKAKQKRKNARKQRKRK